MKMKLMIFVLLGVFSWNIYSNDFPNIAVINTNSDGPIGVLEKSAANLFYLNHPDIYDFLFVYTTFNTAMTNVQQGIMIQYTVKGINRDKPSLGNPYGTPQSWGSQGKLLGAARMTNIDQYPDNPDAPISNSIISPYAGMTTIELQAHEWSHYWLASLDFKKEDMSSNHPGLRGCEGTGGENGACEPNNHWNADSMSGPSVMYGGDITDNKDGTFTYEFGNPKKYGQLDLYAMGLIPAEEVGEIFFLCKFSDIEQCREGSAAVPAPKKTAPTIKSDMTKHIVTIDDITRAMGQREPSFENSQKHFNIAFIIVSKEGAYPFPQQIQRLENIRVRFQEWFAWATDGKATICTELDGDCSNGEEPDDDPAVDNFEPGDESVETPDETTEVPDEGKDEEIQDDTQKPDNTPKDDISETPDDAADDFVDDESVGCGCTIVF